MTRFSILIALAWLVSLSYACMNHKRYVLRIHNLSPNGKETIERHDIHAKNDTVAYSEAAVMFYLAVHAYGRYTDETRQYISRPLNFSIYDMKGNNIDSVLGLAKTRAIRKEKATIIN
jgi:hypothetical protein